MGLLIDKEQEEMYLERLNMIISHKNVKKEFLDKQIGWGHTVKDFMILVIDNVDHPLFEIEKRILEGTLGESLKKQNLWCMEDAEEYLTRKEYVSASDVFKEAGRKFLGAMCKYLDEDSYNIAKTCFENACKCDEKQADVLLKKYNDKKLTEDCKMSSKGYHFILDKLDYITDIIKDYFFIRKNIDNLMKNKIDEEKQLFSLASKELTLLKIMETYSKRKNKKEFNSQDIRQITFDYLCDRIDRLKEINKSENEHKDRMLEETVSEIKKISLFSEIPLKGIVDPSYLK